ncbi:hypothetical protein KMW28_23720 [Flammeovirga yaeyamensis]|uniref:Glycoside hydrolase n=1 Tax=Flammeovirga yaeyamensis TaxID=367791 RepID=A0AAX1NCV9_9BACT|nr:alpha-L-rhamnosidase C-terminal domain-containing protein [Flammeovirga yaeyamensis]MBB3696617.1 hypothetical protein [Flammeovirga yaeyamensis]NMF33291.1 glycoside hydrolase [Flammeovirga yaeyamensis]QWG05430.1 hypothetical protein KMW28_23720 [Flammeovirga yaeyamensis]
MKLLLKKIILSSLLLLVSTAIFSNPIDWGNAQWIWQEKDSPSNTWMCFRKTVELEKVPEIIEAHISVDSKFWLWVNGEMVMFEGGLSRGPSQAGEWNRKEKITPANSWYETVNIQSHLKEGKNTIAILVWYWGRETHKGTHIDSKKGGLLFHSQIGNQTVVSDKSWNVLQHTAYDNSIEPPSKNLTQYGVQFDAQNALNDWTSKAWYMPDYNDKKWKKATEKGKLGIAPWYNVEPNIVPHLINHGLANYENHEELNLPFESNGKVLKCKLPFNKQINPYFEIESKTAGDTIFITTDNHLNQITATYVTKKGKQSFECFSWMNGHDIKYTFPKGIKVNVLKYRWMSVGKMAGSFEVDDPFYTRLWEMGNNTLFVCARDNFMDCPDRERALWIGDVADQASYLFYSMDNAGRQLLKKAILQTMMFSEDGVIGALGPLRVRELVSQSLQFISGAIWPYYLNTGDKATLEKVYPYVFSYLDLFPMQENGLPEYRRGKSADTWDWLDWGVENTIDKEPIQMAFYYLALKEAHKMANVVGNKEHIQWYQSRIESMEIAYDKAYWKDGFYSTDIKKFKDDRANAIAIVSGIAKPKYYNQIVDNVLIPNRFSSPHFEWIVEEAMCIAGRHEASLKRMKEQYQSQVNRKGMTTLYEKFPKGGSYNHAWNAPNTILSKYIAGVQPTAVAWSEFEISPTLLHIKKLSEKIPTVKGTIDFTINVTSQQYEIDLHSPKETKAIIGIPKGNKKIQKVLVNGREVWKDGSFINKLHGLSFEKDVDNFLKFKLTGGEYIVKAIYEEEL